jgi:hypothetical protein
MDIKKTNEYSDEDIHRTISKRLSEVQGYWSKQYTNMANDQRFASGDQWSQEAKNLRKGKPTLTLNFTKAHIDKIVNPIRKNPFGIRVKHENKQINELYQGLIRDIEYRSNASEAYEEGLRNAVTAGIGYIIIDTDYEDNQSLDQTISIVSVPESTNVWVDPYIKKVDGSDMKYAFHITYTDKECAEQEYDLESDTEHLANYDIMYTEWDIPTDSIPELIYYDLKSEKRTRYWLPDGSFTDDVNTIPEGVETSDREINYNYVEVSKYIGGKRVSKTRLEIDYIPVVPVYGNKVYTNGWKGYAGIVQTVFDSQSMVNYYASAEAQLVQSAPVAPWIIAEGQIEGYEDIWATANTGLHDHLPYRPVAEGGASLPPPSRVSNAADTTHLTGPRMAAVEDMQRSTGQYANNAGIDVAGQSGRALLLKQNAADVNSFHFIDNLMKSITQCGKITLQLINSLYDTDRRLNVRAENGSVVPIQANIQAMGIKPYEFDTEVEAGPMMQNEKELMNATLLEIGALMPEKFGMIADVFVENLQTPGSDEVVRRLKAMLPPEVLPKEEGANVPDPQAIQAMQAADQTIQEMKAMLENYEAIIQNLQTQIIDNESDRKAKIETAQINSNTDLAIAELNNSTKIQIENIKAGSSAMSDNKKIMADRQKQINSEIKDMIKDSDSVATNIVAFDPMNRVQRVGGSIGRSTEAMDLDDQIGETVESIDSLLLDPEQ